jgi:DNA-binding response OmpR family regulator
MSGALTLVVIDDTEGGRELYREWLGDECVVRTAGGTKSGVDMLDHEVDLVILDRELSGADGREVAVELDSHVDDVHIVMVSWQAADFDIVEYPIDSYVEKPVTEDDALALVDQYRTQRSYQADLEEYFSLSSKLAAIEAEHSATELESNPEYDRLKGRVEEKRESVDEALSTAETDWDLAFKSCGREMGAGGHESGGFGE